MRLIKNCISWCITALLTSLLVTFIIIISAYCKGELESWNQTYYAICIFSVGYLFYSSIIGFPLYALLWHRESKIWDAKVIIPLGFMMGLLPLIVVYGFIDISRIGKMHESLDIILVGGALGLLTGIVSSIRKKIERREQS